MSTHFPGDAFLHAHALLQNPRLTGNPNRTITFDATIETSSTITNPTPHKLLCSLTYAFRENEVQIRTGVYDLEAKIVCFHPRTHIPSPVHEDSSFSFMGEILMVSTFVDYITQK